MGERAKKPPALEVKAKEHVKKYKMSEKVCPFCKKTFWGTAKKIYDTDECKRRDDYEKHRDEYNERRRERYYAAKKSATSTRKAR